jgi:small subunit ribosomal protein S18
MAKEGIHDEELVEEEIDDTESDDDEEEFDDERVARPRRERPQRGYPSGRGQGGPRRYSRRRKVCSFCADKAKTIDYKDVNSLQRLLDGHGKIVARRKTGTCAKHQRRLAVAVKRARHPWAAHITIDHHDQ